MCLGVPMQVRSIEGFTAHCEVKGIARDVSLFLIQDAPVELGDYVLVHVGYAIQKLEPEDAEATWQVLDQFLEAEEIEDPSPFADDTTDFAEQTPRPEVDPVDTNTVAVAPGEIDPEEGTSGVSGG